MKRFFKKIVPKLWLRKYSEIKNANKSAEEIFTEIYQKNYWGKTEGSEYFSGTGTYDQNVLKYIDVLVSFIRDHDIKSVFEIGCGDFSIMKQVLQQVDTNYTGADVVFDLVQHLQKNYANEKNNFIHFNAITAESYPVPIYVLLDRYSSI